MLCREMQTTTTHHRSLALLFAIIFNHTIHFNQSFIIMGWAETWNDILSGGNQRWKVDNVNAKRIALEHILQHHHQHNNNPMHILCPLAGDDPFMHYAWSRGHIVTAIDIVPDALKAMRSLFGSDTGDWSMSIMDKDNNGGSSVVWKHKSERVTIIEGDILTKRTALHQTFDVVYDKDSFGAMALPDRTKFCERISEYMKDSGTLYVEVKMKDGGRESGGPPYHVEKEDLIQSFGNYFDYVSSLGEVYSLNIPGMKQTGHILRRSLRR